MSLVNALVLSCLLATVHRQSGCGAAEQPSGDCCCDEKNSGECKLFFESGFLTKVCNHGRGLCTWRCSEFPYNRSNNCTGVAGTMMVDVSGQPLGESLGD